MTVTTTSSVTVTTKSTTTATASTILSPTVSSADLASASPPSPASPQPDDPRACVRPPDDDTHVTINDETITVRTRTMLETAQALYGGAGDLLRLAQGSYTDDVTGSFGTHAGGGAVDISIRDPRNPAVRLFDDVEAMVRALRQAGFAAWFRAQDEVYPESVPHIHAIAIGDPALSPAAREQLTGAAGYFRGFNGLPVEPPVGDRHGGPVVCGWMGEAGYRDLRP